MPIKMSFRDEKQLKANRERVARGLRQQSLLNRPKTPKTRLILIFTPLFDLNIIA